MTSAQVNRLAILMVEISALTKEADALKEKFRMAGDGVYSSRDHSVTVNTVAATRLDQSKVKKLLTPDQYKSCTVTTYQMRVVTK